MSGRRRDPELLQKVFQQLDGGKPASVGGTPVFTKSEIFCFAGDKVIKVLIFWVRVAGVRLNKSRETS